MVLIPYKEANRIHFFQFKNQAKKRANNSRKEVTQDCSLTNLKCKKRDYLYVTYIGLKN